MDKYFGGWATRDELVRDFDEADSTFPSEEQILFASYEQELYEGYALVVFERDGKLWEVEGSHCSCMGLEGQWKPCEVTWPALAMRPRATGYGHADEAEEALIACHRAPTGSDLAGLAAREAGVKP